MALYSPGSVRGRFELPNQAIAVSIWAWGQEARGEAPRGRVWLSGELAGEFEAQSPEVGEYAFPVWGEPTAVDVEVRFVNDYYDGPGKEDRNLFIHGITITTVSRNP